MKLEEQLKSLATEIINLGNKFPGTISGITGRARAILARNYPDSNEVEQDWEDLEDEFSRLKSIQEVYPIDRKEVISKLQNLFYEYNRQRGSIKDKKRDSEKS